MGILDWLRSATVGDDESAGMSRRDFFARVAGRAEPVPEPDPLQPEQPVTQEPDAPPEPDPSVLHTFHVARFPYHDGPVLVPILRSGDIYRLAPEPPYSREPTGLRIERGRDLLGFVPDDIVEDLLTRVKAGQELECRAVRVDPAVELQKVLLVEVRRNDEDPSDESDELVSSGDEDADRS
jgi:hypothetical protein